MRFKKVRARDVVFVGSIRLWALVRRLHECVLIAGSSRGCNTWEVLSRVFLNNTLSALLMTSSKSGAWLSYTRHLLALDIMACSRAHSEPDVKLYQVFVPIVHSPSV